MKGVEFGEPQFAVAMESRDGSRGVSEKEILAQFSKKEQKEIKYKQRVLSSLAYFIGKDFEIPVELNKPGGGWHWNFKDNKIGIDPKDLLEKPLDYLRYLICHEGSHRRISRTDFIPLETWQQPGFSFMMNAIEDPRVDNFVAENYPKFKEFSQTFHDVEIEKIESKYKEEAKEKLGHQPRFIQAGFEYLRLWYKETQGQAGEISKTLPQEVQQVVQKTIASARDSWWRYPLKGEADSNDDLIKNYAKVSYEINLDEVWPEFKKLVDEDMKDQNMQESLKDMQSKEQQEGNGRGVPQQLKDKLTPQQQKELEEAIDKAIEEAKKEREKNKAGEGKSEGEPGPEGEPGEGKKSEKTEGQPQEGQGGKPDEISQGETFSGKPIDLDSLSEDLKQKINEFIDSLPPEKKRELQQRAEKEIKALEQEINEELEGKLSENPQQKTERASDGKPEGERKEPSPEQSRSDFNIEQEEQRRRDLEKYRDVLEKSLEKDANVYEKYRSEVLPIIESLENDLREIFVARRASRWKSGFKTGKRIDIKTRIQEKAKGISAVESKAWQKRELPTEKDYAISILVDLSGSMSGQKIKETFKALIVLSEVLNKLSIKTEILGFNDRLYEYQTFGESFSREIRENMGGALREVDNHNGGRADYNDDGWALQETSKRLARQKVAEKFLMVLSDGVPEESPAHRGSEFDLSRVVNHIMQESDQKLIGLGIGGGTGHVEKYYPNSLANINVKEMAEKLADTIREMIVNYQNF
ncbi:MAG: VWA domain-containing protein [Candidatus Moranbacteria bacterium]|nr:VWA domain-containing protein [Candidatus Moranbacteria bacterium]